jgi:hypothetical protein
MIAVAACDHRQLPTELSAPIDATGFVVQNAARLLDDSGHFILPAPDGEGMQIVSPARAREIAEAAVAMFSSTQRPYLERQRGGNIDFRLLRAESRVYFAESPLEQSDFNDVHPGLRKDAGPYYLVTFRQAERPVLSVSVSAYDTDLNIENGKIVFPVRHGNDFRIQAIRQGDMEGAPVSPEHAARIAFEAVGARVIDTPQLVLASREFAPQYARWRLRLDRPITVRGVRGRDLVSRELFVGMRGTLSVPSTAQPDRVALRKPDGGAPFEARRRPDLPLAFEPVTR